MIKMNGRIDPLHHLITQLGREGSEKLVIYLEAWIEACKIYSTFEEREKEALKIINEKWPAKRAELINKGEIEEAQANNKLRFFLSII